MPKIAAKKEPTASALVFSRFAEGWRLCLIMHPRLGMLLPAGGHVEADETTAEAAVREVLEETGAPDSPAAAAGGAVAGGHAARRGSRSVVDPGDAGACRPARAAPARPCRFHLRGGRRADYSRPGGAPGGMAELS